MYNPQEGSKTLTGIGKTIVALFAGASLTFSTGIIKLIMVIIGCWLMQYGWNTVIELNVIPYRLAVVSFELLWAIGMFFWGLSILVPQLSRK